MADISAEAIQRAEAKVKQLVPNASRVESIVRHIHFCPKNNPPSYPRPR